MDVLAAFPVFVCFLALAAADTPANCTYEEVRGVWTFQIGKGGGDRSIDCSKMGPVAGVTTVELDFPDTAVDQYGNTGFWTLIYNQGFEVVIHGRKYFAFSKFEGTMENATSFCDQTMPGWTHDSHGNDWACFVGKKKEALPPKVSRVTLKSKPQKLLYKHDPEFIAKINSVQNLWTAKHYPEYESMTVEDMIKRAGGRTNIGTMPRSAPVDKKTKQLADALPEEFDWRNVDSINFVSPVRNQGGCGSCYAFAAMAMNEARLRIRTNNSVQLVFSPQDVVDCSQYSQGCDGGFPYLIGGKYAEDYGVVEESCNPYKGQDQPKCGTDKTCKRHYAFHYRYVGGYYGACNEEQMKISLVQNGPMAVAFEVYNDFMNYEGGIYKHTALTHKFNPFELTNHAVTLVGYGVDKETGVKFWSVKNSWGDSWGEEGFFRIVRGEDECAIESIAVESFPAF